MKETVHAIIKVNVLKLLSRFYFAVLLVVLLCGGTAFVAYQANVTPEYSAALETPPERAKEFSVAVDRIFELSAPYYVGAGGNLDKNPEVYQEILTLYQEIQALSKVIVFNPVDRVTYQGALDLVGQNIRQLGEGQSMPQIQFVAALDVLSDLAQDALSNTETQGMATDIFPWDYAVYGMIACVGVVSLLLIFAARRVASQASVMADSEALFAAAPVVSPPVVQESLANTDNRLDAIEHNPDGVFITDSQGRVEYMNKALVSLCNSVQPSLGTQGIGRDWIELYPQIDPLLVGQMIKDSVKDNGAWSGEVIFADDNKATERVMALAILKLPNGSLVGSNHDITALKHSEKEREELQTKFYQAQKMEAIGRMAGGIAHDFNNILAAINGYAEFLIEDLQDRPTEQSFASKILSAGHQARELVDQILTFSRRSDVHNDQVDLITLVSDILSMVRATGSLDITIEKSYQVDHAVIEGSSTQLSQLLMNLCVNAMDAMEGGKGSLSVEIVAPDFAVLEGMDFVREDFAGLEEDHESQIFGDDETGVILQMGKIVRGQPYICVRVADTGTGMSRVVMEHIFEPFFTTKPVDKGTGLGLATVHGVVTQHDGAMIIRSRLNQGTVFELYFQRDEHAVISEEPHVEGLSKFEFEGARILLVEDQESVRDMNSRLLMRTGFEVITAGNGKEALDILKHHQQDRPFDLVVSDYAMPEMNGMELIHESQTLYPNLPYIIITGLNEEKLSQQVGGYPLVKKVLRKPVSQDALKEHIYGVLKSIGKTADDFVTAGAFSV